MMAETAQKNSFAGNLLSNFNLYPSAPFQSYNLETKPILTYRALGFGSVVYCASSTIIRKNMI